MTASPWRVGVAAVAGAAAVVGASVCGTVSRLGGEPVLAVMNFLVALTFALAAVALSGIAARRPDALLCLGTAAAWTVGTLGTHHIGPLPFVAFVGGPTAFAGLAALILRYPGPCLTRLDCRLVGAILVWVVMMRGAWATVSGPADHGYTASGESDARLWWPTIAPEPQLASLVGDLFAAGGVVLAAAFAIAVSRRFTAARGLDRPVLMPVFVASMALATVVSAEILAHLLPDDLVLTPALVAEYAAIVAVAGAFLASALRRRLCHARLVEMVTVLHRPAPADVVRHQLRRTLRDPGLDLYVCPPEEDDYVDLDGRAVSLHEQGASRFLRPIVAADGTQIGAVAADESLGHHPALVDAALSAAALALQNGRLLATVRNQLAEVRTSRVRIIEAGDAERRRLERDLHDGLQQRMLGIKMRLASARAVVTTDGGLHVLDQARDDVDESLAELRAIARGIHPALLTQVGLPGALHGLVERMPLDVTLEVPDRRWAPTIEATAYFVVCEALTNVVKYAGARRVAVRIRQRDRHLHLRVHDDGCGGAHVRDRGGLAGLRDRIAALDGEFVVSSEPDGGTEIVVTVPCG